MSIINTVSNAVSTVACGALDATLAVSRGVLKTAGCVAEAAGHLALIGLPVGAYAVFDGYNFQNKGLWGYWMNDLPIGCHLLEMANPRKIGCSFETINPFQMYDLQIKGGVALALASTFFYLTGKNIKNLTHAVADSLTR